MIPWFDGVIFSLEWKEALWDKFVIAAPRPCTPSEQHTVIASFDRGAEPRTGNQPQDGGQVA